MKYHLITLAVMAALGGVMEIARRWEIVGTVLVAAFFLACFYALIYFLVRAIAEQDSGY